MKVINQDLQIEKDFCITDKRELDVFFARVPSMKNENLMVFRAICLNNGVIAPKCPVNDNSLCTQECFFLPRNFYHPWDGKNVFKCPCG